MKFWARFVIVLVSFSSFVSGLSCFSETLWISSTGRGQVDVLGAFPSRSTSVKRAFLTKGSKRMCMQLRKGFGKDLAEILELNSSRVDPGKRLEFKAK